MIIQTEFRKHGQETRKLTSPKVTRIVPWFHVMCGNQTTISRKHQIKFLINHIQVNQVRDPRGACNQSVQSVHIHVDFYC